MEYLSTLGQSWDSFDAYLFDIDGTLLHCADAVHYFAFCDALRNLSGRELTLEGVTAHGNTDIGILRDALALAGIAESDWRPKLTNTCANMCSFVEERNQQLRVTALPGVLRMLNHLKDKGAVLGIATGNLQDIGKQKLRKAGLLNYFEIGGWSDGYERREDVFRSAVTLMRASVDETRSICIVGDTPADIRAAHSNELPVIAVATGVYQLAELEAAGPELCLRSFEDLFSIDR